MACSYGFSIFETFLVNDDGKVFLLNNHIERLLQSAFFFNIDYPLTRDEISEKVIFFIKENCVSNMILRLTLSAGNKQKCILPTLWFSLRNNTYSDKKISTGLKITLGTVKSEESILLKHKTSNYLENYLIANKAIEQGFDDVLFINTKSYITETTRSNIFFVKDKTINTPHIKCGLLPGIIRNYVLNIKHSEYSFKEGMYTINDLYEADEVFLSNSAMGIIHVPKVNKRIFNGGICGPVTNFIKNKILINLK